MTDIDFDELDRAVNSLMNQRQQDSDRASEKTAEQSTNTPEEKPAEASAPVQAASAAATGEPTPVIGPMPSTPQETPAFTAHNPDPQPMSAPVSDTPVPSPLAAQPSAETSTVTEQPSEPASETPVASAVPVVPEAPVAQPTPTQSVFAAPVSSAGQSVGQSVDESKQATEDESKTDPKTAAPETTDTDPQSAAPVATPESSDAQKTMPEPIVPKRTGRIMDVMPLSSGGAASSTPIISRAETAAAINRTNAAVDTMVTGVVHAPGDKSAEESEVPKADASTETLTTVAQPAASTSVPSLSMTEAISQSLADSAQAAGDDADNTAVSDTPHEDKAQSDSLESPFLSNTIVQKRPLGSYKTDAPDHTEEALAGMIDLANAADTTKEHDTDEPADSSVSTTKPRLELTPSTETIAEVEDAPAESPDLDRELMALEMGIASDLADTAAEADSAVSTKADDALTATDTPQLDQPTPEAAPAFPPASTDTEQAMTADKEAPSTSAETEAPAKDAAPSGSDAVAAQAATHSVSTAPEPVPMFDVAATQPQPLEEKKSSGFLTFIIVLILLLLGAGGGAAAYYFLLVQ